jgi:hypothetical protein
VTDPRAAEILLRWLQRPRPGSCGSRHCHPKTKGVASSEPRLRANYRLADMIVGLRDEVDGDS